MLIGLQVHLLHLLGCVLEILIILLCLFGNPDSLIHMQVEFVDQLVHFSFILFIKVAFPQLNHLLQLYVV